MKNRLIRRILSVGVVAAMAVGMLAGCGSKGGSASAEDSFTWFINKTDGDGMYYENYEECNVAQFVNAQYWDSENGGIGTADSGKQLNISFLVPVTGSEQDNFSTMISTGDYPDIMDVTYSADSVQALHESGYTLDITEYVNKYMPNYLKFLDENPELRPLVTVQDGDGKEKFIAIYSFCDGVEEPWEGTCYRRDWVVKYAKPTEYVWDWDSDYVKENGHPAVTPLDKAVSSNNLEGWKKNEVTSFTADYGSNPDEDYTDNVVFPSGTADPLTISDWEWMFEAFEKAQAERGWADDTGAYGISIQQYGYSPMGDLNSSFGGGTGSYYVKDGKVSYDGTSDNFKAYTECMQKWYEEGWLDKSFNERKDVFFMIDTANVNQGKVGMWCGMSSQFGTVLQSTCADAADQKDAYVMGCALPINDVYGGADQMYKEPDALYQTSRKGCATVVTDKAKDKDLATLFTYFDWTYTREGAKTLRLGLNKEQLDSMEFNPDPYKDAGIETAYTEGEEDGKIVYKRAYDDPAGTLSMMVGGGRMDIGLKMTGNSDALDYVRDNGQSAVIRKGIAEWSRYLNTGSVDDYTTLLSTEESDVYSKLSNEALTYQSMNLPKVIKGEMKWDAYAQGLEELKPEDGCEYLQKYVDLAEVARR